MALRGAAKVAYMRDYPMAEYMRFRRAQASPRRRLRGIDMDVLRLAAADYTMLEIAEALDVTFTAVQASLARSAAYIAPAVPPPRLMVDPGECLPFDDERYSA
jgi:hypothetical protein